MADDRDIEALADAARHGDEHALERLLAAVRPLVYRWALVQTAAPDDAEDITQQALLRVHGAIGRFHGSSRFTTWVYTVTRRVAADWRRTRLRRARLLERGRPVESAAHQPDRTTGELVALVRTQLAALPARQRELFDLVDLQGHTPAEAAELLGMNHNTARVHVMRARRAIRARILAEDPALAEELQ